MPEIGQTISHYRIIEKLGQGGMGEVFLAHDTSLDRKVALKFLPDIFSGDPERLARFEREAKLLASLNHPNIAAIHGLEEHEGKRFLVLELVEGQTLAERLKKGHILLDETLDICRQIAEGLEAAHEKGIIHRDLKPSNVMVDEHGLRGPGAPGDEGRSDGSAAIRIAELSTLTSWTLGNELPLPVLR